MKNSAYGIISIFFGVIGIICLGNCMAFFQISIAIAFSMMGIADPEKYKWSSITGFCLAMIAIGLCCGNILIKNADFSTLLSGNSVYRMDMDYYY